MLLAQGHQPRPAGPSASCASLPCATTVLQHVDSCPVALSLAVQSGKSASDGGVPVTTTGDVTATAGALGVASTTSALHQVACGAAPTCSEGGGDSTTNGEESAKLPESGLCCSDDRGELAASSPYAGGGCKHRGRQTDGDAKGSSPSGCAAGQGASTFEGPEGDASTCVGEVAAGSCSWGKCKAGDADSDGDLAAGSSSLPQAAAAPLDVAASSSLGLSDEVTSSAVGIDDCPGQANRSVSGTPLPGCAMSLIEMMSAASASATATLGMKCARSASAGGAQYGMSKS